MSIIQVPDLDIAQPLEHFSTRDITGGSNVTIVKVPAGQSGVTNVVLTPEDETNVVVVNNNNPSATTNIILSPAATV